MASRDRLTQLTDAELEQRFVEAERNALEWSGRAIGRHAQHQATRWMELVASCRDEIARRAAGGAIEPPDPSPIPALAARLAAKRGVTAHPPATTVALAALRRWAGALPPPYIELLSLHDGIDGCFGDRGGLLSSTARKQVSPREHQIIALDRAGSGAGFDRHSDEAIVEWHGRDRAWHASLADFLAALVTR